MQSTNTDKEHLPIEKRRIRGSGKHVLIPLPGLHEQWVTPRKFVQYVFPPTKLPNRNYVPGAKEKWLESMSYMLDDIWWLCELQYHQFWSQIIFDHSSMNSIKSFLHLAPLQQLYFKIVDQDMLMMYKCIKKAVFQFMKRLLRIKDSELNFMSPEKYIEVMKKNNLVPVSLLFCLCTLYAKKELETVREMVAHVVQYNENLKLDNCVVRTIQLFSRMKTKLKQASRVLRANMKNSQNADDVRQAVNAYRQNLSSSVQFLANAAINISNFLSVFADGCEIFLIHDFDFHIIRVYKKIIIPTYLEINILYGGSNSKHLRSHPKLISMLELTRLEFVKSFHICLNVLLNKFSTRLLAQETTQRIVQLLKFGSKIEQFLNDVNNVKSLNEYHELIKNKCPNHVDMTALNNLFESINTNLEASKEELDAKKNCIEDDEIYVYVQDDYDDAESGTSIEFDNDRERDWGRLSLDDCSSEYSDWSKNENSDAEYECYLDEDSLTTEEVPSTNLAPVSMSELELQSAISQVKDLLPHLGDGFIAMCLQAYRMDVSAVINSVLESTLPESLNEIDFSLSKIPNNILKEVEQGFENIPTTSEEKTENSGFKEFKRVEYSSYKDMYNDKSAVKLAKDIYEKYRNTEEDKLYNDDVDEDYGEQLFAPTVEVDAEGFYTEYTNIPVCNPNRKYTMEGSDPTSEQQTMKYQPGRRGSNRNILKSYPGENWRDRKSSESLEKREDVRDGSDRSKQIKKNNRNRKKSTSQNSKEVRSFRNGQDKPQGRSEDNNNNNYYNLRISGPQDSLEVTDFRHEREEHHHGRENVQDGRHHSETYRNEVKNRERREKEYYKPPNSRERWGESHHGNARYCSENVRDEGHSRESWRDQPRNVVKKEDHNQKAPTPNSRNIHERISGRQEHHPKSAEGYSRNGRIQENRVNPSAPCNVPEERNNLDECGYREEFDTSNQNPLNFCENPEIIRARAEHRRQVKLDKRRGPMEFRNKNLGRSSSSQQEDNEQKDWYFKNVHKSSNANHGRRYYSDKKRKQ